MVRGVGLLRNIDDIKQVVIAVNNGIPVRIGDVASVVIGNAPRLGLFQFDNNPDSVEGIVYLRRGENASEVLARVREKITNINNHILPPGIQIKPFYDRQVLLDITVGTVKHTMFFGIGAYGIAIASNVWGPTWGSLAFGLVLSLGLSLVLSLAIGAVVGGLERDPPADRGRVEREALPHGPVEPVEVLDRRAAVDVRRLRDRVIGDRRPVRARRRQAAATPAGDALVDRRGDDLRGRRRRHRHGLLGRQDAQAQHPYSGGRQGHAGNVAL